MQPEKACDKEDDDDGADDVENVHGVLRLRHARFQMKARRSKRKRPGLQVGSMHRGTGRNGEHLKFGKLVKIDQSRPSRV